PVMATLLDPSEQQEERPADPAHDDHKTRGGGPVPLAHRRRQPRGASGSARRSVSVEERRDRHETERRYERGVVDLTDGSGATVSGTVYDRIQSDQVLRRAKRVLDIRVRTAAGIDVQNGYPAAWRIRCPVLLDQLRI